MSVAPPPFAVAQLEQDPRAIEKSKAAVRPQEVARCRVAYKAAPRPTPVAARRRVVHKAAKAAVARSSNARSIRFAGKKREAASAASLVSTCGL
jgi:hypothetical protein